MQFIILTAIDLRSERDAQERAHVSEPQLDDLERPIPAASNPAPEVVHYLTHIFVGHIREFYARKGGHSGTRIVYANGAATIVKETVEQVENALNDVNN